MQQTKFCKIPYPNEDEDPFYDSFVTMMDSLDNIVYGFLNSVGNIIVPPTTVYFNASNSTLSWDDDFLVNILSTNTQFKIQYGPDLATRQCTLNDGDKIVIAIPVSSGSNLNGYFKVISGPVSFEPGVFVFGIRVGNKFYCNLPTVL